MDTQNNTNKTKTAADRGVARNSYSVIKKNSAMNVKFHIRGVCFTSFFISVVRIIPIADYLLHWLIIVKRIRNHSYYLDFPLLSHFCVSTGAAWRDAQAPGVGADYHWLLVLHSGGQGVAERNKQLNTMQIQFCARVRFLKWD